MQWFIVPNLDGPVSGGMLYNRQLIAALKKLDWACEVLPLDRAATVLEQAAVNDGFWVDSLYLDQLPLLARAARAGARLGLIVHYLPSLVAHGDGIAPSDLTSAEATALKAATMFLVPSAFMRGIVRRLAGNVRPVLQIEPGRPLAATSPRPEPPVGALLVANLVEGKGIARFLARLSEQMREGDEVRLSIVGGDSYDSACAERCHVLGKDPRLRWRVHFLGELGHDEAMREMAASNLLVSCSHMESYGMALMEARVLGVPILARRGGHVAALVGPDSGGELFAGVEDLVAVLLRIGRDPMEHRRRMELARARTLPPRPWSAVAQEFISQLANLKKTEVRGTTDSVNRKALRGVG